MCLLKCEMKIHLKLKLKIKTDNILIRFVVKPSLKLETIFKLTRGMLTLSQKKLTVSFAKAYTTLLKCANCKHKG